MFCKSCGSPLGETNKFCPRCGAPVAAEPEVVLTQPEEVTETPAPAPAEECCASCQPEAETPAQPPVTEAAPASKRKAPLIGIIAGVVAVAALVLILILTGSPKAKVSAAFTKTAKELDKIGAAFCLDDISTVLSQDSLSQDLDLRIDTFSEESALEGFGMTLKSDMNMKKREIGIQAIPYYGSVELLQASLALEDEMIYLSLPALLPEPYYGINTETLLKDLENQGVDVDELGDMRFNIFDLCESIEKEWTVSSKESEKLTKAASKELLKAISVEKTGKETIAVNGTDTKCTVYAVLVPEDALLDWMDAYEDAVNSMDYEALIDAIFDAVALPQEVVDEFWSEADLSSMEMDMSELKYALEMLGDVELDVYVSDGKVASVQYDLEVYGEKADINLYLGGGKNYADDLSLEITVDGESLTVVSSGDHTAKSGTFSDTLVISVPYGEEIAMTSEYNRKSGDLAFSLQESGMELLSLEGMLQVDSKSVTLDLDELTIWDSWDESELLSLQLNTTISGYNRRVQPEDAVLFSEMTQDDLMELLTAVQGNLYIWANKIINEVPELMYLF